VSAIVPFGALPGFNLAAEMREVASYYGVNWRALRGRGKAANEQITLARHALIWKLSKERKLSTRRIAMLIDLSHGKVAEAVKLHEKRIDEFKTTSGIGRKK